MLELAGFLEGFSEDHWTPSYGAEKAGNKTVDTFAGKSHYFRHLQPLQYAVVMLGGLYPTSSAPQKTPLFTAVHFLSLLTDPLSLTRLRYHFTTSTVNRYVHPSQPSRALI
jgi:hypothetical protein